MQTQLLTFTSHRTLTVEVSFDIDSDTKANLESWANTGFNGYSPLDTPGAAVVVSESRSDYRLTKANPPVTTPAKAQRR